MGQITQTFGYVERVTSEMWTASPEDVRNHAARALAEGIRAAGMVPHGEVEQASVRGLCFVDLDLVEVSPPRFLRPARFEWRVTSNRQEWRDEPYFDPEYTTEYRIAFTLTGFKPPVLAGSALHGVVKPVAP